MASVLHSSAPLVIDKKQNAAFYRGSSPIHVMCNRDASVCKRFGIVSKMYLITIAVLFAKNILSFSV
jgi:hypothetical protein